MSKTIAIKKYGETPFGAAFFELIPFEMVTEEQALAYKNLGHVMITVDDAIGSDLLTRARSSSRLQEWLAALVSQAEDIRDSKNQEID